MKQSTQHSNELNLQVDVVYFEDENSWVAYCPTLELSTYGDSEEDVKNAFDEALEIFIADVLEKNTLESYLLKRGWRLEKTQFIPPQSAVPLELMAQLPNYVIRDLQQYTYLVPAA